MQTSSTDDSEVLPIPCTVCLSAEGVIGTARVWAFYPNRCHVESWLQVSPGMMVSLSLHLPGAARVKLENGLVTWARASECGVRFLHGSRVMNEEKISG
jgi:hypothetical protein